MATSPFKFHWLAHGRKYLVAAGALAAALIVWFIYWTIGISLNYYSSSQSTVSLPAIETPRPRASDLLLPTSIRLDIDVGKLEFGERIIVSRDLSKVVGDRLSVGGFTIDSQSSHAVLIEYSESLGQPIDVRRETRDSETFGASIRPVQVRVHLSCSGDDVGFRTLLQRRFQSAPKELVIPSNEQLRKLGEFKREWYRTAYAAALAGLRAVELPARKND